MFKKALYRYSFIALLACFAGCGKDEPVKALTLNIAGLEDLGGTAIYEGWIKVNDAWVSTGKFKVDSAGALMQTSFDVEENLLNTATAFRISIEPIPDESPDPTDRYLMAGDFNGQTATLTVGHSLAFNYDFSAASGIYQLQTPTDDVDTNEVSGIWWMSPVGPSAGLSLPVLPEGWVYEGWVIIDTIPVSTGTFTSVTGADYSALYSGTGAGLDFPGEDFLSNPPDSLEFPLDLSGYPVAISIEPNPDNSLNPFLLKPLTGEIPNPATDRTIYSMTNHAAAFPTGTVTR